MGDARYYHPQIPRALADVKRGGFTFNGGIGSENNFFNRLALQYLDELVHSDIFGANAVNGRQMSQQNKVLPLIAAGLLNSQYICRCFNHTQKTFVPAGIAADTAQRLFGQGTAALTPPYSLHRFVKALCQ